MLIAECQQFLERVQPLLESNDLRGLLKLLKEQYTPQQIIELLNGNHLDARKVALLSLGLVGPKCCIDELARHLKDPDPVVNEMAEHALWSIWLRSGSNPESNRILGRGTEAMNQRDFACAIEHFNQVIEIDPDFAEAYNQRAIAHYLQEQFHYSICDCRKSIRRMPVHFGAWAGMGHCHAHLGQTVEAIRAYEKALDINPHLNCVSQAIEELKRKVG